MNPVVGIDLAKGEIEVVQHQKLSPYLLALLKFNVEI